jgi:hypothetical protein
LPTSFGVFPTKSTPLATKGENALFECLICGQIKTPKLMNYKVKSLIYLFAFILSALLYQHIEMSENSGPNESSGEISMLQTDDLSRQDPLL